MEQFKDVGTIQIALLNILTEVRVIFWEILVATLAFSIAITKLYVAERSFLASGSGKNET